MNERIKQLAQQSELWDRLDPGRLGISTGGSSTEKVWGEELQEFAELIVQECCQIVLDCSIPGSNNERDFVVTAREIKQHFGVEE
jgi:hypothetical protein